MTRRFKEPKFQIEYWSSLDYIYEGVPQGVPRLLEFRGRQRFKCGLRIFGVFARSQRWMLMIDETPVVIVVKVLVKARLSLRTGAFVVDVVVMDGY